MQKQFCTCMLHRMCFYLSESGCHAENTFNPQAEEPRKGRLITQAAWPTDLPQENDSPHRRGKQSNHAPPAVLPCRITFCL